MKWLIIFIAIIVLSGLVKAEIVSESSERLQLDKHTFRDTIYNKKVFDNSLGSWKTAGFDSVTFISTNKFTYIFGNYKVEFTPYLYYNNLDYNLTSSVVLGTSTVTATSFNLKSRFKNDFGYNLTIPLGISKVGWVVTSNSKIRFEEYVNVIRKVTETYEDKTSVTYEKQFIYYPKLVINDTIEINFGDLILKGYNVSYSNNHLEITNLKDGLNILDPIVQYYQNGTSNNNSRDGYIGLKGLVYSLVNLNYFARIGEDKIEVTPTVYKAFFSFDTTGLPNRANISDATLNLYALRYANDCIDPLPTNVYNATGEIGKKALGSALIGDAIDYAQVNYNMWSPTRDLSTDGVTNRYWSFKLNNSAINHVGFTDFRLTKKWVQIETGCGVWLDVATSENLGLNQDPYLNITYDLPYPNVNLVIPENNNISSSSIPVNYTFACTINQSWINGETWINNITFFHNISGSFVANQTIDLLNTYNVSNASNGLIFYHTFDRTLFTSMENERPLINQKNYFDAGIVNNALNQNDSIYEFATASRPILEFNSSKNFNTTLGTIVLWYKPKYYMSNNENRHDLFQFTPASKYGDGLNSSFFLFKSANDGYIRFYIYDINATSRFLLSSDLSLLQRADSWHMVALVYNISAYPRFYYRNTMLIYFNSVLVGNTSTWSTNWSVRDVPIGVFDICGVGTNTCEALIDEFQIYNYMLNSTELTQLYNKPSQVNNYVAYFNISNISLGTYNWSCNGQDYDAITFGSNYTFTIGQLIIIAITQKFRDFSTSVVLSYIGIALILMLLALFLPIGNFMLPIKLTLAFLSLAVIFTETGIIRQIVMEYGHYNLGIANHLNSVYTGLLILLTTILILVFVYICIKSVEYLQKAGSGNG